MTLKTGNGIDPAVNLVPRQVVSPVRKPAVVFSLVLDGWLEFYVSDVTAIAETLPVAHAADLGVPFRHHSVTVFCRKIEVMVVTLVNEGIGFCLVAFGAHLVSGNLLRVLHGEPIALLERGTGNNQEKAKP
jgi:hypothetical protein